LNAFKRLNAPIKTVSGSGFPGKVAVYGGFWKTEKGIDENPFKKGRNRKVAVYRESGNGIHHSDFKKTSRICRHFPQAEAEKQLFSR
jgi:hypothetical protein